MDKEPTLDEVMSNEKIEEAFKKFPVVPFTFERDERANMRACSFGIVASSKSGKTTFLKYLLKKHFGDDIKVFMTQSPNSEIYDSVKKECAFAGAFIPDMIRTCYLVNKHTKNHYPFCVVVDDVTGVKNDKQMTKLMCLYRNSNMSGIVIGQDFTMLNATGRANVNNIILGWQNTDNRIEDNIKLFLRSYFPRSMTIEEKIALYRRLTFDHHFIWIDNLNNTICRFKLRPQDLVD
jgi:hypothetical protein